MELNYLENHSSEYIQLSPFFIFDSDIEFQNYSFKSVYVFLESLKISDEKKRVDMLKYFSNISNIRKLYSLTNGKLSYTKHFNRMKAESISFNNTDIPIPSIEFNTFIQNLFLSIATSNGAYKYALMSIKSQDLCVPELDGKTSLEILSASEYCRLIKNVSF